LNNYRIYYEPTDIKAENMDRAQRLLKYYTPSISKIIVIDKDGFPIKK